MGVSEISTEVRSDSGAPAGLVGVVVLGLGLLGIVLWGSMLLGPYRLATGMLDAREHLQKAEKALSKTQLKQARYYTLAAAAAVDRAERGLSDGGPALDLARMSSLVDDALGEVDHLLAAADHSAKAALGTLNVAQDALRGPRSVIVEDPEDPKSKKIDLGRLEELAATITDVRNEIKASRDEILEVELDNLPKRLHGSIDDALEKAREANVTLADAEAGLKILPRVLGAEGPRTYMIGFQNTAEQRGTGGAILRFSFLEISDGDPSFNTKTSTVYDVDKNRQQISIPLPEDAWYVASIADAQRFGNANWSPDFPLSAEVTRDYAKATPTDLPFPDVDGVFVVDPIATQKLMPGVGPFTTERYNNRISQRRIVDLTLYSAYGRWPVPAVRRQGLNKIVDGFFDNLFDPLHPTELLKGFGDSLSQKHMQLWMTDPAEQAFVERMNWDGAILSDEEMKGGDYVYVVEQNVGGSKLDYFDTNVNTMDVRFEGADALVSTELSVRNGVFLPQPRYSMGDSQTRNACNAGRCPLHRPMLNLYVRRDAELLSATIDGKRIDAPPTVATWSGDTPPTHFENGKKVWSGTLEIPPQDTAALTFDYRVPGVLQTKKGRTVYRLHVQHQPKVRPETLVVRLRIPQGATKIQADGWSRDGNVLVWEKALRNDQTLEVSWQR